mgnify:CR=1 FL=1
MENENFSISTEIVERGLKRKKLYVHLYMTKAGVQFKDAIRKFNPKSEVTISFLSLFASFLI